MEFSRWAEQVISGALDTEGHFFPLDSLQQTLTRDAGTGNVTKIVATNGTNTWTQTMTYTSGLLTNISGWVKV
jgi:hypothetical protein